MDNSTINFFNIEYFRYGSYLALLAVGVGVGLGLIAKILNRS
jgi:hypothetical protein